MGTYGIVDETNLPGFLGITNEMGRELFYGAVDYIYGDRSQEERNEIVDKIRLLGHMWLISKDMQFEPNALDRINASKEIVLSLIYKIKSLNF